MKLSVRLFALLLTLLMMFSVVSCNKKTQSDGGTTETNESWIQSDVPSDLKFDGAEVKLLFHGTTETEWNSKEGDTSVINSALFTRNNMLEEQLDIDMNYVQNTEDASTDYLAVIRNAAFLSGGEGYDIITGPAYYTAALAAEGLFYDLNTADEKNYISTDGAWYNQSFVEATSYKDRLYFLAGDATSTVMDISPVTFFNEDELRRWEITDDLYSTVLDGGWTIEYMSNLIKDIHEDLDEEEGMSKGDFMGLFFNSGAMCVDAMLVASGINITDTDADGKLYVSWADGNAADAFEAIYNLMYETPGVLLGTTAEKTYYSETGFGYYSEDMFFKKQTLFSFGRIAAAQRFATDPSLSYGMLPLPKYDENQGYATTPQDGYSVVAIPRSIGDHLEIATATMELLFEASYVAVRPAYFDVAYKVRYASSADTAKLFDDIMDSITFSFGGFYSNSLGDPAWLLRGRLVGNNVIANSNLTGLTNMYTETLTIQLQNLCATFDSLSQQGE